MTKFVRYRQCGGGALIIDYGSIGTGDTIRGFSKHKQVCFLSRPGSVDITADVDFRALRHAISQVTNEGTTTFGPVGQGQFLMSLGAGERVETLIDDENVTEDQAEDLFNAFERLASPDHMGERFKVLAITENDSTKRCLPGFEALYMT